VTTDRGTVAGRRGASSRYWRLVPGPGERHVTRAELMDGSGRRPGDAGVPLLTAGHLSDLHLCDTQSPARAEFLDRYADDDAPTKAAVGYVGSYRSQDLLTVQVGEAMVRALNQVAHGPVGGAPLELTVVTGDVLDNAQYNELGWYQRLLDGGPVLPDSGAPDHYDGVAGQQAWDESYWHPDPVADGSGRTDRPHRLHGFPDAPGLLEALRQPFDPSGLAMPWLAVHGNHDQLVQGIIPAAAPFAAAAVGTAKAVRLPDDWSTDAVVAFCRGVDECRVATLQRWPELPTRPVTADLLRRPITRAEFVAAHFGPSAHPPGHGFAAGAVHTGQAWYRHDVGRVTVLALDTVNEHGGWQGSVDEAQAAWVGTELADADRERRYVVLASHHPLDTLVNGRRADGAPEASAAPDRRVLAAEFADTLSGHPSLVLWLNGHTHRTTVTGHGSWWEVTAPSVIDYPQQARIVELLRAGTGTLTVATTMLDHLGELPWSGRVDSITAMAGLSRELAANDWQRRVDDLRTQPWAGTPAERNTLLLLADPFA
jgi:metallophosphoesterase (TIGR03767 family)